MDSYYALCVDTDPAALKQLGAQVEQYCQTFCKVESLLSAEHALERYEELTGQGQRVWLVISAQALPEMSGDRLLGTIHGIDPQVITVLLVEQCNAEDLIRALNEHEVDYYVKKPYLCADLLKILEKAKRQYERTTLLNEMTLRFTSSIDLNKTLKTVISNILRLIQAESGSIFLFDEARKFLICQICQSPSDITGLKVPVGKGIVGQVAQSGQIDVTEDVQSRGIHYHDIDEQSGYVTRSMVSVPLICKDIALGVIQISNKQGGKQFFREDVKLLQALSSSAALAIQNAQYAKRLVKEERIHSEILFARQIQQDILPDPFPAHPDIRFEAVNIPATGVAGDFYDYFQVNDREFAFIIGDACGHGIASAIYTMSSRSIIKARALTHPQPAQVITFANKLLEEDARPGMYLTAFYGIYNTETRLLRYINSGHPIPLLYRRTGSDEQTFSSCASLHNTNLPLGLLPFTEFKDAEIRLEPGDLLLLYTDGVDEAANQQGEQFGIDRLIRLIFDHIADSPQALRDRIIDRVHEFTQGQEQQDDITVMIVKV